MYSEDILEKNIYLLLIESESTSGKGQREEQTPL